MLGGGCGLGGRDSRLLDGGGDPGSWSRDLGGGVGRPGWFCFDTATPLVAGSYAAAAAAADVALTAADLVAAGARRTALGVLRGAPVEVDVVVIDRAGTVVGRAPL